MKHRVTRPFGHWTIKFWHKVHGHPKWGGSAPYVDGWAVCSCGKAATFKQWIDAGLMKESQRIEITR